MAFSNQFSLSLELTRLLPLGPLVNVSGNAILKLARELQRSGSDIVVEEDLAAVFGRNRICHQFASSFRTSVSSTSVTRIPNLSEIVLEAGAGPTVRRSIPNPVLFASVIQLSLLTFTHELGTLTSCLLRALEQRSSDPSNVPDLPDHDGLLRTLGTIRDQTAGYRWDLTFSAVEAHLLNRAPQRCGTLEFRRLPFAILQALLDTLTAIQHFPEQRLLRIRTYVGVSTIVVWAHRLLGMTVCVMHKSQVLARFGEGPEQVLIDWLPVNQDHGHESVVLLNATDGEADFTLSTDLVQDPRLAAICHHTVSGFGTKKLLDENIRSPALQAHSAEFIVARCLYFASNMCCIRGIQYEVPLMPSSEMIYDTASIIFEGISISNRAVSDIMASLDASPYYDSNSMVLEDLRDKYPSMIGFPFVRFDCAPPSLSSAIQSLGNRGYVLLDSLCCVVMTLSAMSNLAECKKMLLSLNAIELLNKEVVYMSPMHSYAGLTTLLLGRPPEYGEEWSRTCVVSHMGWSLLLASLCAVAPYSTPCHIIGRSGTPARNHVRRPFVTDLWEDGALLPRDLHAGRVETVHGAGQHMGLHAVSTAKRSNTFVGTNKNSFDVFCSIELRTRVGTCDPLGYIRIGFRALQDLIWKARRLQSCTHTTGPIDTVVTPSKCSVFSGWWLGNLDQERTMLPVQFAMTAGSPDAQWAMLFCISNWAKATDKYGTKIPRKPISYLKPNDCCVDCAAAAAAVPAHMLSDEASLKIILL